MGVCVSYTLEEPPIAEENDVFDGDSRSSRRKKTKVGRNLARKSLSARSRRSQRSKQAQKDADSSGIFQCWGSTRIPDERPRTASPLKSLTPTREKPPPYPIQRHPRSIIRPVFPKGPRPRFVSTPEVIELTEFPVSDTNETSEFIGDITEEAEEMTTAGGRAMSSRKSSGKSLSLASAFSTITGTSMETVLTTLSRRSKAAGRQTDKVIVYPYTENACGKDPGIPKDTQDFTYYLYGGAGPPTQKPMSMRRTKLESWQTSLENLHAHETRILNQRLDDLHDKSDVEARSFKSGFTDVSDKHYRTLSELVERNSVSSFQRGAGARRPMSASKRRRLHSYQSDSGSIHKSIFSEADSFIHEQKNASIHRSLSDGAAPVEPFETNTPYGASAEVLVSEATIENTIELNSDSDCMPDGGDDVKPEGTLESSKPSMIPPTKPPDCHQRAVTAALHRIAADAHAPRWDDADTSENRTGVRPETGSTAIEQVGEKASDEGTAEETLIEHYGGSRALEADSDTQSYPEGGNTSRTNARAASRPESIRSLDLHSHRKELTNVIDVIISSATRALVKHVSVVGGATEPGIRRMLSVFRQGSNLAIGSAVMDRAKLSKSLLNVFSKALQSSVNNDYPVKETREEIESLDQQFLKDFDRLRQENKVNKGPVKKIFVSYQHKLNLIRVRGLRSSLLERQKLREEEDGQLEKEARHLLEELDDVRRSIRDVRDRERQQLDVRLMEKLRSRRMVTPAKSPKSPRTPGDTR